MTRVSQMVRGYPWVVASLAVAVVALALLLTPAAPAVPWLVSGFALLVAATSLVSMVRDLMHGHAGVDVLAVIAITSTVVVGEYWAALVVCLMLTGGEALEDYANGRARRELTSLLERAPQTAHRLDADGSVHDIPAEAVAVGDELVVKPNEVVPVDGVLLGSGGTFDESSLTGESLPVERGEGEEVLSGVLNSEHSVTIRATRVAAESQYAGIVNLVREASESRSRVVRLADRFAVPFTLVALAIAGIAWLVSGQAIRFAEVLVVATPCPLIIAAPVAYMGGMSRAARSAIIVKSAETLERMSGLHTVAFDKTGTLTVGEPTLERLSVADGFSEDQLLLLAASAEQYSSHVLATAVVRSARGDGVRLLNTDRATEQATNGVTAEFPQGRVVVGKRSFVAEAVGHQIPQPELRSGEQAAWVAIDGRFAGVLFLRDEVRTDAAETVAELRQLGIRDVIMVTGDGEATARQVADELGIADVHAQCLPADKVQVVTHAEHPVAMVGDGVNDAPVLAAADVGIAMGARGASAASESAHVVLLADDVSLVATAVRIGRDTMRIALQSIVAGIALSTVLMLVAAFGWLPALAGAWLQEVVDLVVILAALRALGGRVQLKRPVAPEAPVRELRPIG